VKILNEIKNNRTEIFNKCNENQDKIKKDIKDIKNIHNKINFEKTQNNNNINTDNLNDNNFYDKKINNKNQDNSNRIEFNKNRISNNVIRKKYNNPYKENQNNEKKKENINYENPLDALRIINKNEILDKNNRNNLINNYQIEYNNNYINNFLKNNNNSNLTGNYLNNKKININDYVKKPKEEDKKLKYYNNEVNERNDKPKIDKKTNDAQTQKLYQSINSIFFIDYQQKVINDQKINEFKKEELQKAIFNDKISGRNILKNYYMNFIEENVLPLFKKSKYTSQSILEIIKYNISVILECLGMNKNYYNNYYYQNEANKKKINRRLSEEAVLRFRNEYNLNKEEYTDEALERRLIENNLDINKTFEKMFG
jgi:hypothetical protein